MHIYVGSTSTLLLQHFPFRYAEIIIRASLFYNCQCEREQQQQHGEEAELLLRSQSKCH